MVTLIITVLFGLIIAYFATQNTTYISLHFLQYTLPSVPTYVAIVGALFVGLVLSWIISIVNGVSTGFAIRGKEGKIKDTKKENAELTRRIHQLELENAKLVAQTDTVDDKSL